MSLDTTVRKLKMWTVEGLTTSGEGRKQWYLERIAKEIGINLKEFDYEEGTAP